jgi:hypothetical protein
MDSESPPNNRKLKVAIGIVLVLMIALAAWAWWIPNRVFDPWLDSAIRWLDRIRHRG